MKRTVYADNAATTSLSEKAYEAMKEYMEESFYNPSSTYSKAVGIRSEINVSRDTLANLINAKSEEIVFTGGGAEADSLAIVGFVEANAKSGGHIVTTNIEHHAVMEACKALEDRGFLVTYVPVKEDGVVDVKDIEAAIRPDTVLVSVMYINNETGAIQPIGEISEICRSKGIAFHTDAVQAFGKIPIDVEKLGVDMMSVSAHKFHGPKGAGFLYVRKGISLRPIIFGGSQENGRRGGTENVPAIIGMAVAADESLINFEDKYEKLTKLRDYLWDNVSKRIRGLKLNGEPKKSFPGILNFSVEGVEGQSLLIMLDMKGVYASTGSACALAMEEPSHVIKALGRTDEEARASLRLSLDSSNSFEDVDYIVDALAEGIEYLRKIRG